MNERIRKFKTRNDEKARQKEQKGLKETTGISEERYGRNGKQKRRK
jgi:hypothetical protein